MARVTDQDALNALSVLLLTSPKPAATEQNRLAWRSMYELVETSWDDHDAMLPFESVYGNLSLLGLEDMHQRRVEDLFLMAFRRDDGGLSFKPRGLPFVPRRHCLVQKHYDRFPSSVCPYSPLR